MMFLTSIGEKGSEAGVSIQNVNSVRKVNTLRKIYLQPLSPFTSLRNSCSASVLFTYRPAS
jgi:hypothetical protein